MKNFSEQPFAYFSFHLGPAEAREYASRLQSFLGFVLLGRGGARPDSFPHTLRGCRLARQLQPVRERGCRPHPLGHARPGCPQPTGSTALSSKSSHGFPRCSLCGRVIVFSVHTLGSEQTTTMLQPVKAWWRLLGSLQTPGIRLCVGCWCNAEVPDWI